jgi:hypothetical protein
MHQHSQYPTATRSDVNAFPFAVFVPSYGRLLVFVRWTSYSCPGCGHTYRRDYWTDSVHLGPKIRACTNCNLEFDDGSRQWAELSIFKKIRVFFSLVPFAIWVGFTMAGVVSLFVGPRDEHSWPVVVLVSAFGLIPALVWSPVRLTQVIRSIRRYNERGATHPA